MWLLCRMVKHWIKMIRDHINLWEDFLLESRNQAGTWPHFTSPSWRRLTSAVSSVHFIKCLFGKVPVPTFVYEMNRTGDRIATRNYIFVRWGCFFSDPLDSAFKNVINTEILLSKWELLFNVPVETSSWIVSNTDLKKGKKRNSGMRLWFLTVTVELKSLCPS